MTMDNRDIYLWILYVHTKISTKQNSVSLNNIFALVKHKTIFKGYQLLSDVHLNDFLLTMTRIWPCANEKLLLW